MSTTLTKTTAFRVSMPELKIPRVFEDGETSVDTAFACEIVVLTATSKADAIKQALEYHRAEHGIPSNVSIRPTVVEMPVKVGTTINSVSGTAVWRGKTVVG